MAAFDISKLLDEVEQKHSLARVSTDPRARKTGSVSSGLLCLDLLFGGGYMGGSWYTFYGGEQSGKSTSLSTGMGVMTLANVPGVYYDFEGSSDPVYQSTLIATITKAMDPASSIRIEQVFGIEDPDTGKYLVSPAIRLYSESIGDTMFDAISTILRQLPDKVFKNGKWYYVHKEKQASLKEDRKLSKRGRYYYEAEHGYPQLVVYMDSYPAMFPEKLDEGKGQGMAAVARMFSENIPKIAGRLRRKNVLVVGVNQLRLRPGVAYGNPEYEPAGEAVKFISSVRIRTASRAVPHGKGQIEEEPSVLMDGSDQYQYVCMTTRKNKTYTSSGLEVWQRVWKGDPTGRAYGYDPVWDLYYYLVMTGQASRFGSGKRRPIDLQIYSADGKKVLFEGSMDYMDFKLIFLSSGKDRQAVIKDLGITKSQYTNVFKDGVLWANCREQILDGWALQRAYAVVQNVLGSADDEDGEYDEDVEE